MAGGSARHYRAWPQFADHYAERFRRIVAVLSAELRRRISGRQSAGLSISFRIESATDKANPAQVAIRRLTFPAMPSNHPLVP